MTSTDPDCLFCAIVAGDVPAEIIHEGPHTVAFRDIAPAAPTHVLVVPRDHYADLGTLAAADPALTAELFVTATQVALETGVAGSGYRVVANTGADGGQTVGHVHVHVLGGRAMTWPPG